MNEGGRYEPKADAMKRTLMCLFRDLHEARTGDHNYVNKRYVQVDEAKAVEDVAEEPYADISRPEEPAVSKTSLEETQETISLDTDDKRYVTYAQAIKERIAGQWKCPKEARRKNLEGRLVALFSLNINVSFDYTLSKKK
jgi:putative hydrolase of HD superfamily